MINHVRTLLQNQPPGTGDEYVPADFVTSAVPAVVAKVKRVLWGRTPAHQTCIRQLMQILHSTELEEHVLAKDPRVTYLPFDGEAPKEDLCDLAYAVATLDTLLTAEDEEELFGDTTKEPNKTWRNLWKQHDQLPYRIGGLILAVADCTERARAWHTNH